MAKIIEGKALREKILSALKKEIESKVLEPKLAIVQVGNREESNRYIEQKIKAAEKIEAVATHYKLAEKTTFPEIKKLIGKLNRDKTTNGIIVQLPLPTQLNKEEVTSLVQPIKDVDGLVKDSLFVTATAAGILEILREYKVEIKGKTAVVVGQGTLVGKPVSDLLEKEGAEVIRIDIDTPKPIDPLVIQGDIVIAAAGEPGLITSNMVKDGAVVIDAGSNITSEGKLVGDVDFETIKEKASLITPVPGGVGPMTVAMLMKNLVQAALNQV